MPKDSASAPAPMRARVNTDTSSTLAINGAIGAPSQSVEKQATQVGNWMASAGAAIWFAPSAEASSQVWEGCNQLALFVAAHVRSPVCRRCRPAYILRRCAGWPQVALRRAGQECPILQGVPRRPWMTGGRVRLGRACAERELFLNSFVPVLTRRGPRARNTCVTRDAQVARQAGTPARR